MMWSAKVTSSEIETEILSRKYETIQDSNVERQKERGSEKQHFEKGEMKVSFWNKVVTGVEVVQNSPQTEN